MSEEEIKQNAEAYASKNAYIPEVFGVEVSSNKDDLKQGYIAGAHSRDEEIEQLGKSYHDMFLVLANKVEQLRNPWISVEERLPEEDTDNISIPVVAITNNGYWFKGKYDYNNKDWFFSEDPDHLDFEVGEFVTHWMPIPELKKW